MSIATEVVYEDGVTAVDAGWLNLVQEHLAGWINLQVSVASATVKIAASADDGAASIYISGEMRRNEEDLTFTFTGQATGTYNVYAVGDLVASTFGIEVSTGAASGTKVRKLAEVDWNLSEGSVTALRAERGQFEEHEHTDLGGAGVLSHANLEDAPSGDQHTQYMHTDARRPFTSAVVGVYPTAAEYLATKEYADDQITSGVPVGSLVPFAGSSAPAGWLLCDGTSYLVSTYPNLAARLSDAYGGDGGTNFNVPDMRAKIPYVKPASGTGSTIGDSGGSLDHTHTQPTHTHAETAHTHTMTAHTHSSASTSSTGAHTHTQSSTGSAGSHTHAGPSHTHSAGSYAVGTSGGANVGSENGSTTTPGLYAESDTDQGSSSTSHSHSDGSYGSVSGSSSSATMSHYHYPSGNAKEHTHAAGSVVNNTGSGGTGSTGSAGAHTHTNPTTGSSGAHTHTVGTTTSALTAVEANAAGVTSASGGDVVGSNNPAFIALNYIIKADN